MPKPESFLNWNLFHRVHKITTKSQDSSFNSVHMAKGPGKQLLDDL